MRRLMLLLAATLLLLPTGTASAGDTSRPRIPWVGDNPYGFLLGDSLTEQADQGFGMGWRSLGKVGWPGATAEMMRGRMEGTRSDWPAWTVTESSVQEERTWFRDAGWWVIELGTNDVKFFSAEQFAAQVEWFMGQSRGRPVLWLTINNPPHQAQVDAFNEVLRQAAARHPNLKLVPWERWAHENPRMFIGDRVHAAYPETYRDGMFRLIQHAAPHTKDNLAPVGYWYPDGSTSGPVPINGWAAGLVRSNIVEVNVRSDWRHVTRQPVTWETGDLWAQASSGRAFGLTLGAEHRGRVVCVDVVDTEGRWKHLGCRRV